MRVPKFRDEAISKINFSAEGACLPAGRDPPLEEKFIHTSYFLIRIIRIIRKFGRIRIIRITVFIRVIIRYIRANSRYSHYGFLFVLFANSDIFE